VVADVNVTAVTLALIPLASGILLSALMAAANAPPFCSSAVRSAVGVLALKNFSQFAVISATAAALSVADADATAGDEAAADDAAADEAAADELDDELELQAATDAASARASAGTRMIRRATSGNRIAQP
jgi:hypothetical protein